jgi:hypothetical protein
MFATSFKGQFNFNDVYTDENQIAPIFNYISLYPLGNYSISNTPDRVKCIFNYNIYNFEYIKLYDFYNDNLIKNYDLNSFLNNIFQSEDTFSEIGKYYVTFKCTSIKGDVLEVNDKNIWNFTIQNPDYSSTHYTNDYLI